MMILAIILGLMVVVLGFTTFNLLKKNERQEDILAGYMEYLSRISGIIELSDKKLKEIDHKGSFESDDEIGFFFQSVKQLQEALNAFQIKNL